ncbi:putative Zinc finger, RING-CH-type, Zinc finger, RING/FYVE/PHD-type [Helianthus annuus]|nr:putative Zinc finger, RING-CH-type, Zinc finger, RING/FYVE/PHD-type [Helianthus annuus]
MLSSSLFGYILNSSTSPIFLVNMISFNESQFDIEAGHGCGVGGDDTPRQSGSSDDSKEGNITTTENVGLESSVSEFSVVDLESNHGGGREVHLLKVEKDCRICHLSLDANSEESGNYGIPIELGCSCKDDLAAAHKHCAEAWFKIKGNR